MAQLRREASSTNVANCAKGKCPFGHELQPWTAPAGVCSGCGKNFSSGEQVMDCRMCQWLLCELCCPRSTVPQGSVWGALCQLPFYAAGRLEAVLTSVDVTFDQLVERSCSDLETTYNGVVCSGPVGSVMLDAERLLGVGADAEDPPASPVRLPAVEDDAMKALILEFCDVPTVAPSRADLDAFWDKFSLLYSCTLDLRCAAEEMCQQLAQQPQLSSLDNVAQARQKFRALLLLEDLLRHRGAVGQDLACEVACRSSRYLRHLAKVGVIPSANATAVESGFPEADPCPGAAVALWLISELLGDECAFDGCWTDSDTVASSSMEVIDGGLLFSSRGVVVCLAPTGRNKLSAHLCGHLLQVELVEGRLIWSDGSVWVRDSRDAPGSSEFFVALDRTRTWRNFKLGLDIDNVDGSSLLVVRVHRDGLVATWNAGHPGREVKPGDRIVAVNSEEQNTRRMLGAIRHERCLRLRFQRDQRTTQELRPYSTIH
mmetsp:Transcript_126146/g.251962  ORF Transcript_126146/g.251962 Transcript_126146/m.251962 type:complete len:487 (-) Transcript_126146:234-1694(-)|eukprot:CAMPEP_0172665854 /NCGR_PEP_ID=MMETSP1074-20121228/7485_1 /TAXON_ID=2916 /ORGANISM="Ceratium fusus, Strain PA161109" /LENGTH=486 /DNA_ID=CAMNT_0013482199 /DNA_START=39 /DNA_END=1499 /DNA_ORIENTATION=-